MRFGILGYGKIVREAIAPAILRAGSTIEAVGSLSNRRPDGFEGTLHPNYTDCIQDPDVDAIYIATPNSLHVPLAREALREGKPVLCEKPAAMNMDEYHMLEEVQRATSTTFMEALMVEHHPQWARVASATLGHHKLVHASFTYGPRQDTDVRSRSDLGGGVWLDIGCYGLWACYKLGARNLRSVGGRVRLQNGVPVHCHVNLEFEELDAQLELGSNHFRQQSVTAIGSKGRIFMPQPFNPVGETRNSYETATSVELFEDEAEQYSEMIAYFTANAGSGVFLHEQRSRYIADWSDRVVKALIEARTY